MSSGFTHVGEIIYPRAAGTDDEVMEAALEAGASDVESDTESHYIYTERAALMEVSSALEGKLKAEPSSTNLIWKPSNTVVVEGEPAETLLELLEALNDLDDVQNVYANYELSDAEMARLAG